ncbi:MAG: N-methyl-L-tryptophan oxidase [Aggregatilineales bacterium]
MHYDAIVIGLGGMGSAALYQLAKRGLNVLGIEQFGIAHDKGSSHGLTRIIRLAYFEDPSYVPLLRRAYDLWHQIEQDADEKLFYQTGSIDAGRETDDIFAGSLRSCKEHNLAHEVLDSTALSKRFPGYQFPSDMFALFQPQGGFLVPEACISNHVKVAQQHGAEVHTNTRVLGWDTEGDGVSVTTENGTFHANKLIISAGAWARKLLPVLHNVAVPERQVLIWIEVTEPEIFTPEHFPVFNCTVPEGNYYGFPQFNPTGKTPGFKYGRWHHRYEEVDPDDMSRLEIHPEDESLLRSFAEQYFPGAAGATQSMKACIFTNSPDEHFIIDTLNEAPQVVYAAGMTGHGFKFCSVIGEILADLAQNGETRHNIDLLRSDRLLKPDTAS